MTKKMYYFLQVNRRRPSPIGALDQLVDTEEPVGHGSGALLVSRLPRQQPRQSGTLPGGIDARTT